MQSDEWILNAKYGPESENEGRDNNEKDDDEDDIGDSRRRENEERGDGQARDNEERRRYGYLPESLRMAESDLDFRKAPEAGTSFCLPHLTHSKIERLGRATLPDILQVS